MKSTLVPVDLLSELESKRTGLHLSSLIKALLTGLDPKKYGGGPTSATYARFEMGYAFEEMLSRRQGKVRGIMGQCSFEKDGITGTLDGLDTRTEPWRVMESKATWMSAKNTPSSPKLRHWIWQIMGYCMMAETHHALLEVLFVNGDYKPMEPCFRAWNLEFTSRELKENWQMMLNQKRAIENDRHKGKKKVKRG